MPPDGGEHQLGVDICNAIRESDLIHQKANRLGTKINGIYSVVTKTFFSAPVIHLDFYLSDALKNYDFIFEECLLKKEELQIENKVVIQVFQGVLGERELLTSKILPFAVVDRKTPNESNGSYAKSKD